MHFGLRLGGPQPGDGQAQAGFFAHGDALRSCLALEVKLKDAPRKLRVAGTQLADPAVDAHRGGGKAGLLVGALAFEFDVGCGEHQRFLKRVTRRQFQARISAHVCDQAQRIRCAHEQAISAQLHRDLIRVVDPLRDGVALGVDGFSGQVEVDALSRNHKGLRGPSGTAEQRQRALVIVGFEARRVDARGRHAVTFVKHEDAVFQLQAPARTGGWITTPQLAVRVDGDAAALGGHDSNRGIGQRDAFEVEPALFGGARILGVEHKQRFTATDR